MSEADARPDFKSFAKDKALREPACKFCGGHEYSFDKMPKGTHVAIPVYHLKDNPSAHLGVILRGCKSCGHIELFMENRFRSYLGLPKFVHESGKKS